MNTKHKVVDKERITKIVATRLGLEVVEVTEVIAMYQKVIAEHLRKDFLVSVDDFYTMSYNCRKGYIFRSGLDQKKYKVSTKHIINIEPDIQFIEQVAKR